MWYKRYGLVWIKQGVETKPNPQRTKAAIIAHRTLVRKQNGKNN